MGLVNAVGAPGRLFAHAGQLAQSLCAGAFARHESLRALHAAFEPDESRLWELSEQATEATLPRHEEQLRIHSFTQRNHGRDTRSPGGTACSCGVPLAWTPSVLSL
jgi:hypothetical protein